MSNDITDQLADKDALRADLAAASAANEQAIAREQNASRAYDRLSAQLRELRAADDDDPGDDTQRADDLDRDLAAAEQAMADAATQAAAARQTIKEGVRKLHDPIKITKDSAARHLEAIAAAAAEVARIDSAILRHEQDSAARQAARAAERTRHQEELARFLAGKALGEIPVEATFEPPPAAPDDGTQAADSATLAGLASRRDAALAHLEKLRAPLPAMRAATILTDLESVLRDYASAAAKEQRLRLRANALRSLLDPYEVHKPGYLRAPEEEPINAGVNQERDRLAGTWPALWATSPH